MENLIAKYNLPILHVELVGEQRERESCFGSALYAFEWEDKGA